MFFFPGQFFRPLAFQVSDLNPGNDPSKIHATMLVKKHRLAVTRCGDPSDILTLPTNKPGGKSPLCPHTLVQQALSSVGFPHFPLGSWGPRGPSESGKGQTQPPRRSNHTTSFLARELWNWQLHTLFQPWSMSVSAISPTLRITACLSLLQGLPERLQEGCP